MVRVFVLYAEEPDAERYAEHVELCRRVQGAVIRHGPIFGSPTGKPKYRYYFEYEFPDREAFEVAVRSPELAASGAHAEGLGVPFEVFFADVDG
jgi:hypothetical protein